jgi:hypothetical protein
MPMACIQVKLISRQTVDPNFLGWGRTGADFETGFGVSIPLNRVLFRVVKAQLKHRILH